MNAAPPDTGTVRPHIAGGSARAAGRHRCPPDGPPGGVAVSSRVDDGHHAVVFVVEDVAVVDGAAGKGVERDADLGVAAGGEVHDVLPGGRVDGLSAVFDDLHGPYVQVQGVVHRAGVSDGPFLDGADAHLLVDPIRPKFGLAFMPLSGPPRRRENGSSLARVDVVPSLMPWISCISLTLGVDLQGPRIVAVESTRARFLTSLDPWPGRVAEPATSKGLA